jgi:flagellar FliJ protein
MENILQIKQKLEDQAKAEYSIQMGILRQEEEKLALLKQRRESFQQQLKEQVRAVLDLMRIRQLEDSVENIKYNINLQKAVIAGQQKKVQQAREKLDHAMIERKTYEKLKENAFEEFKKEVNAEEQKEINELVSFRFGNSREREG